MTDDVFTEPSKGFAARGLALLHEGFRTRLKWHRLRRRIADPVFSLDVMQEGFRLGASMELDLRVRRDGGFVVLHDKTLDRETTGAGAVSDHSAADLRDVHYLDSASGAADPPAMRPLILAEDLAAALQGAHPDALLQFDMKDDLATIGARGLDRFAALFGDRSASIIVSGDSLELIAEIGERLPVLRRGIDPTDKLVALHCSRGAGAVEAELRSALSGPTRPDTIYLAWELVLEVMEDGLDLVDLCHGEGKLVDAWTFPLENPASGFNDREWEAFSALIALKPDQITTDEAPATEEAYSKRLGR